MSNNQPPTGTITSPDDGTTYDAGDTIDFTGTASDPEDGSLTPGAFAWWVDFHHHEHAHPFLAPASGLAAGSFTIPTIGERSTDVFYRLYLSVSDSFGFTDISYRDIFPNISTLSLATVPPSLSLTLNGQPTATPYSAESVIGISQSLGAPSPQTLNGIIYVFDSWSDGGAATHDIFCPASPTTYAASFRIGSKITAQPASILVSLGNPATFSVGASGPAPLTYQWQRNGVNIAAATSSSYSIATVAAADHGAQFRCVVTTPIGNLISSSATLTVSVTLRQDTSPSGLQFVFNGQIIARPWAFFSPIGLAHTLAAVSPQTLNGITYEFDSWSLDGVTSAAAVQNIVTPPQNTTYTAIYRVKRGSIGTGTGLLGTYYDNADFTGPSVTRTDANVFFNWYDGSPVAGIGPDTFSVRWTGWVEPQFNETYTFYTRATDGVRLWVDGQLVIDDWTVHPETERASAVIRLKAGRKYAIRMDYYENYFLAVARLLWSSPSTPKAVVPKCQLYPAP